MTCPSCGTALTPSAKFCHKCGARLDRLQTANWKIGLPWGLAGAALGGLIAIIALRGSGSAGDRGPGSAQSFDGGGPRPTAVAPDISQMSPEERARRLFDRVMGLAERGERDSVQFFIPMAIGAYLQLPALDLDAHYDMGLLYLAGGDAPGALAQADTIMRQVPTHLYGFVLRGRANQIRNNAPGLRRAYADFLKNEAAERARQRPEYAEHAPTLAAFHDDAVRASAVRPGGGHP